MFCFFPHKILRLHRFSGDVNSVAACFLLVRIGGMTGIGFVCARNFEGVSSSEDFLLKVVADGCGLFGGVLCSPDGPGSSNGTVVGDDCCSPRFLFLSMGTSSRLEKAVDLFASLASEIEKK